MSVGVMDPWAPAKFAPPRRRALAWVLPILPWALALYTLWVIYINLTFWSDEAQILRTFSLIYNQEIETPARWMDCAGFIMNFVICPLAAIVTYCVRRLVDHYKRGDFYSVAAVGWLHRATLLALIANIYSNVARCVTITLFSTLAPHAWEHIEWNAVCNADEILKFVLFLSLFGLADLQKTSAEMASDHAQII